MNAVAKHEEKTSQIQTIEPVSETAAILSVIERAAMNPNVDIDKMQKLLEMRERVMSQGAKKAFNAAFARMQPELPAVEKKGKGNNGAYGKWEDIQGAIQPVIARHGFSLSFKTHVEPGAITVTAILHHEDGHDDSTDMRLPTDKSGAKNDVQAVGSSVSYGKRYAACALLNIRVGGEDDNGKAAGLGASITDEQADHIRELAQEVRADVPKFLAYLRVPSISDIPASGYADAVKCLEMKRARK